MMIVAMVALGGCGNAEEPINDTNPIATPVVTETTKNETVTNKETPVPTEKVEPTAEPVIEPAEEELTWENSGLSYEIIETANMSAERTTDTLYLVKVTNSHNSNTYYIDNNAYNYNSCFNLYYNERYLAPGELFEFIFETKDYADTFVNNITSITKDNMEYVSIRELNGNKLFAPEVECFITNEETYGAWKAISISCNNYTDWYFKNGMPETAITEWYGLVTTISYRFYDANGVLVGVYADSSCNGFSHTDTLDISINANVNFETITAVTIGEW